MLSNLPAHEVRSKTAPAEDINSVPARNISGLQKQIVFNISVDHDTATPLAQQRVRLAMSQEHESAAPVDKLPDRRHDFVPPHNCSF
jgi:hypothetical protein